MRHPIDLSMKVSDVISGRLSAVWIGQQLIVDPRLPCRAKRHMCRSILSHIINELAF